jgi:hypothetical protein
MNTLSTPLITGNCTRCGKELKDTASIEAGIGPKCRGFANEVLAKEIPTKWDSDRVQQLLFVPEESFPEATRERWNKVYAKIFTSKGMNTVEAYKGEDWRKTVEELVFFMSVAPTNHIVETLLGAIRGLGYERYAAVICGDASTGESTAGLDGDTLWLIGPRNKVGHRALVYEARAFWNSKRERYETDRANVAAFARVVGIYWPFTKGIDEAVTIAKQPYSLQEVDGVFVLRAPYNPAFVAALKDQIHQQDRRYDATYREWQFRPAAKPALDSLLSAHFAS